MAVTLKREPPVVTSISPSVQVPLGGSVVLTVEGTGVPAPLCSWTKDDLPLPGSGFQRQVSLADTSFFGSYRAVLRNSEGEATSEPVVVSRAATAPTAVIADSPVIVAFEEDGVVTAVCSGYPAPSCLWTVNGERVEPSSSLFETSVDAIAGSEDVTAKLVVKCVAGLDDMAVELSAENEAGTATATAIIRPAEYAPVFTLHPQGVQVELGSRVELRVAARGCPAVAYRWHFGGKAVDGVAGHDSPVLVIDAVTQHSLGDYTCVATNDVGFATSSVATIEGECLSQLLFTSP